MNRNFCDGDLAVGIFRCGANACSVSSVFSLSLTHSERLVVGDLALGERAHDGADAALVDERRVPLEQHRRVLAGGQAPVHVPEGEEREKEAEHRGESQETADRGKEKKRAKMFRVKLSAWRQRGNE
jgi:hypothetical protein